MERRNLEQDWEISWKYSDNRHAPFTIPFLQTHKIHHLPQHSVNGDTQGADLSMKRSCSITGVGFVTGLGWWYPTRGMVLLYIWKTCQGLRFVTVVYTGHVIDERDSHECIGFKRIYLESSCTVCDSDMVFIRDTFDMTLHLKSGPQVPRSRTCGVRSSTRQQSTSLGDATKLPSTSC